MAAGANGRNGTNGHANGHSNGQHHLEAERSLLHEVEAERAVLCCCLRENSVIPSIELTASDFYREPHQQIFQVIVLKHQQGEFVDTITLAEALRRIGQLDNCGGYGYLGELWTVGASPQAVGHYASIVKDYSIRRELHRAACDHLHAAMKPDASARAMLDKAQARIAAINPNRRDFLRAFSGMVGGVIAAPELLKLKLPEQKFVVQGVLPEGLSMLAGKPKIRKSWLALNIAIAVASGGCALGQIEVMPAPVLYLALEDTSRRLQDRMRQMMEAQKVEETRLLGLALAYTWKRQDRGGLEELEKHLEHFPDTGLVIIDTWSRFRPAKQRGRDPYEEDTEHLMALKAVADAYHCPIVLIYHCRKMAANDPLEEVHGSIGVTGTVDGVLVLKRERGQHDATLFVTGRDLEEREIAMRWEQEYLLWSILGEAEDYRLSRERSQVIETIRSAGKPLSVAEVATLLGKKRPTVSMMLTRMKDKGQLFRTDEGKYLVNTAEPAEEEV